MFVQGEQHIDGGFVACARLLQSDYGCFHIDAHLVDRSLVLELALTELEFIGDVIGLCGAVAPTGRPERLCRAGETGHRPATVC